MALQAPTNAEKVFTYVGRVKRWQEDPSKISPVSCTKVRVRDTYFDVEGNYSRFETIAGSREFVTRALKGNAGVAVDLSDLRPKGTIGSNGLVAQGVTNFLKAYSVCNEEVRRGNNFKNGAVLVWLDFDHPDLVDYLTFPKNEIPWLKRAVYIDDSFWNPEYEEKRNLVYKYLADGDIFVAKKQWNTKGERLYSNVCNEVLLKSRSTCTLGHVNLGQVETVADLRLAIPYCMEKLITEVWNKLDFNGEVYLKKEDDPQVGLGLLGLANMLAYFDVSYENFVIALEDKLDCNLVDTALRTMAEKLAIAFYNGYIEASNVAIAAGLDRAFVIAPTATCAYNQTDIRGYVCSPEISPPVAHPVTKKVVRQAELGFSDTPMKVYQYPLDVEIASYDVTVEVYDRLCIAFQRLMNVRGLAHSISYNWWVDKPVNEETFKAWYNSHLKTIYYRWVTRSDAQDKTSIRVNVTDDDSDFWLPDSEDVVCSPVLGCAVCGDG
jgi:Ribonucleotide reductase, barrel domain